MNRLLFGVVLLVSACGATPVDVLREADGREGVPSSKVTERALAAVDIYSVFAKQAEELLGRGLPQSVAQRIIRADAVVFGVISRLEPLTAELVRMENDPTSEGTPRWRFLMCRIPSLSDALATTFPELQASLAEGGATRREIPATVLEIGSTMAAGVCNG